MIDMLDPVMPTRGCGSCAPKPQKLPMTRTLCVGFGMVTVTRDGEHVWSGDTDEVTVGMIERLAFSSDYGDHIHDGQDRLRSLNQDWRIQFEAPLSDATYQRQGRRKWICVATGKGFA